MLPEVTQLLSGEVGTHPGVPDSKLHDLFHDICVLVIFWDSVLFS